MPTCLECGEKIERGMYCVKHRLETGSTLGVVIDDRPGRGGRVNRGGDDSEPENPKVDTDIGRGNYRGG